MNSFITYSLETAISIALFYSAYWIFLKNDTFFRLNRFYLVASLLISSALPLLNISVGKHMAEDSFIARNFVLPVQQLEKRLLGNGDEEYIVVNNKQTPVAHEHTGGIPMPENNAQTTDVATPVAAPAEHQEASIDSGINWLMILMVIYCLGAGLLLLRFISNLIWLFSYASSYPSEQIMDVRVIRYEKNISPFSFLNTVFISDKGYSEADLTKIITHEKVHIRQKHSADLIILELLLIVQWFNPFAWLYKRAVKINHEYLADQGTLNAGIDLQAYQYSLLNQVLRENNFEIVSSYNLSVKKRIAMMMKKRSSKFSVLKLAAVLPIALLLFSAFAFSSHSVKPAVTRERSSGNALTVKKDTIKKVSVSVDYLKQLEGVYNLTNDPTQQRRIRFEEVLGELIADDIGYVYRLIPVGDGKFINPDDHSELIFDTRDRNNISLLLFGTLRLKKLNTSADFDKRSVGFALWRMLAKDSLAQAEARYRQMKESGSYFITENEMNWSGYQLLNAGKAKEAAFIFRINTETYPKSFNVYDSYAEALLAMGNKTDAIANYAKSLRLNPGSKSGIKKLEELGVRTDTIIKTIKVSADYLKLLEGHYISVKQPNMPSRTRHIVFEVTDGVLMGNDDGYKYKLIPVGDGKFINPDDGATLLFSTKDKNAITLLLFGRIAMKKVEPSDVPHTDTAVESIKKTNVSPDYLQLLAGLYVSTNQPHGVRKIKFEVENGELTGNDAGYIYKIIPVGDGTFINPDDNATFVFDTKDKNNISLLLFGKINLNKVK